MEYDEPTTHRYQPMDVRKTEDETFYYEMLAEYLYLDDCYNTNKFLHFRELLKMKGMVVDTVPKKTTVSSTKRGKEMKALCHAEKMERLSEFILEKEDKAGKGKGLNIPVSRQEYYQAIFLEPFALSHHFALCSLMFYNEQVAVDKYERIDDYDGMKAVGQCSKIKFIKKLQNILEGDNHFNPSKDFESVEQRDTLYNEYLTIYGKEKKVYGKHKNKPYQCDWSKPNELTREIKNALSDLIGSDNITSKRTGGGKEKSETRRTIITVINSDYHIELMKYRQQPKEIEFDNQE